MLYYFYGIDVSVILAKTVPRRLNSKIVVFVEDFVEISPLCFPFPDRFPLFQSVIQVEENMKVLKVAVN